MLMGTKNDNGFTFTYLRKKSCYGSVLLSSFLRILIAGEDRITVKRGLNESPQENDGLYYKSVKVALYYAPVSQVDCAWRKTADDLSKDKTCQFTIVERPHDASVRNQSFLRTIEEDVPEATYFVKSQRLQLRG
ncbi:hypothetical protein JRO89_XS05G0094900 [Xanthoceras sorbifolium]|uniref:Uncharacterized protein n=1 Tax=Xanthoceras sorbifolium TaxID=99658 RepID=A0ABQ8I196_9ROSI|nr:hypothetical protein JRO89_XS05G0094900 [Xanthoceras sorbifolium]